MNSYHNQYRRVPGKGECHMPEMPGEKECSYAPKNEKWPVGMTYVPMQVWKDIYQPDEGLHKGTIFKELDLPFLGRRVC